MNKSTLSSLQDLFLQSIDGTNKSCHDVKGVILGFFTGLLMLVSFISTAMAEMQDYPIVKLQALDKSTARTITLDAKVGTTIEHRSLFIKIQACRKSEPLDKPESASFLQIWEVPINAEKSEWVFSGWMFASSPALSAMDHAVYDVWVLDCLSDTKTEAPDKSDADNSVNEQQLEAVQPEISAE